MSRILFQERMIGAFIIGGVAAVIVSATSYLIGKTHEHSDDMKELFERVLELNERLEKCEEETQDHELKK